VGLWPFADMIKTKGQGYTLSEGDGLAYSYSLFNDYRQIARACQSVHFLNSMDGGPDLYRTAAHVAPLGVNHRFDTIVKPAFYAAVFATPCYLRLLGSFEGERCGIPQILILCSRIAITTDKAG